MTNRRRHIAATICISAAQFALWWYLIVLAGRTRWYSSPTSVGSDVVILVHVVSALSVALAAVSLPASKRAIGVVLTAIPWVLFLVLNLIGVVWPYRKEAPDSLWELLQRLV